MKEYILYTATMVALLGADDLTPELVDSILWASVHKAKQEGIMAVMVPSILTACAKWPGLGIPDVAPDKRIVGRAIETVLKGMSSDAPDRAQIIDAAVWALWDYLEKEGYSTIVAARGIYAGCSAVVKGVGECGG